MACVLSFRGEEQKYGPPSYFKEGLKILIRSGIWGMSSLSPETFVRIILILFPKVLETYYYFMRLYETWESKETLIET